MMTPDRFRVWLRGLPVHLVLLGFCALWLLPAIGLLVTQIGRAHV